MHDDENMFEMQVNLLEIVKIVLQPQNGSGVFFVPHGSMSAASGCTAA